MGGDGRTGGINTVGGNGRTRRERVPQNLHDMSRDRTENLTG